MGIIKFIKRVCVQTAVYWGNPKPDGFGNMTFDPPREVKCRWTDIQSLKIFEDGKEVEQKAELIVTERLDIQGFLYLGTLTNLAEHAHPTTGISDPLNIDGAWEITEAKATPLFRSTVKFVHTVAIGYGNLLRSKKQYATRY